MKFKSKKDRNRLIKSTVISGVTSRKVKIETPHAGVSPKRVALSPSAPHSKTYGR